MLVERGRLEVTMHDAQKGFVQEALIRGSYCGYLPMFSRRRRISTLVATSDYSLLLLGREAFDRLASTDPPLAIALLTAGTDRLCTEYVASSKLLAAFAPAKHYM